MGIKSKEARKYIFNCLDDMMQVSFFPFLYTSHSRKPLDKPTSCGSAGEHDEPGGDGHLGREGGPAGVHRPAEEDADAGRRQAHHAHEDAEPPLRYHDAPAALPSQLTVSAGLAEDQD